MFGLIRLLKAAESRRRGGVMGGIMRVSRFDPGCSASVKLSRPSRSIMRPPNQLKRIAPTVAGPQRGTTLIEAALSTPGDRVDAGSMGQEGCREPAKEVACAHTGRGGNPAAAPARRMVPLYPGATTTTTLPPLPVDSREQLVYLLTQASELEQGILCEYLFALYSLKRDPGDGLDPEQLALVTRWGDTLAEIAVQEMLHLTLATNLLTAVGATPHLHRPNFPIRCQWYPPEVQVALVPFGEEALRHFLYLERPDQVDVADAEQFSVVCECRPLTATPATLMAEPQAYTTVGHLYRSIGHGFARLVERYGQAEVFIGPREAQATRELLGWSELVAVTDLASAEAAIATIVEQGEGADGDWREAHFGGLSAVLEEYLAATQADPSFEPARPAQPAYVRRPPDQPLAVVISDPLTAQVADVFDAAHQKACSSCCAGCSSTRARPTGRWTPWPAPPSG